MAQQSRLAALGGRVLVARRTWRVRAAASSRGIAALGCADAAAPRRTRVPPVAAAQERMTNFDHTAIDELLHSRVRLAIIAFLAGAETADFSAMREVIKTNDRY